MTRPNIFNFATSELSQDAFLCWLIASADYEDAELRDLGLAFIAWLWEKSRGQSVAVNQVRLVGHPKRQEDHIDILFEAEIAGSRTAFIIEDKTDTSQHGDQLPRYKMLHEGAICIYFKTGYHFGEDLRAREHGYTVIGLREWVAFLDKHRVNHDVFDDYRSYVTDLLRKRDADLAALLAPGGHAKLAIDSVQFEFIKKLAEVCAETVGGSAVHHGRNMGGTPWTHWRFARFPGALGEAGDEVLFHRVDARKDDDGNRRFYLSTRQYAKVKGKPEAPSKLLRLRAHQALFRKTAEENACGLKFARPAGDNQGANESEIGILFFDDGTNSVQAVLEKVPLVHKAFVAALRENDEKVQ